MPRVHKSIDIAVAREHVFAEATDPQKQPGWAVFLRDIEVTSGDGKSAGSKQRWAFKVGPRVQQLEATVTECEENEVLGREVSEQFPLRERIVLTPAGQDSTHVEWTIDYTPPMGPVGLLFDVLLMNRVFQNDVEASLENLKARLET